MLYASLYQFVVNNNSVKTLLIMYIHLFPSKLKHIFLSFKNKHKIWRKKSKIFLGKSIFSFAKVHIYKIRYMHVYVNKSIILLDITNFVWVRSTIYIYINTCIYKTCTWTPASRLPYTTCYIHNVISQIYIRKIIP